MTVVVMRFKGSGETLQKGFDTVSQAIAALGVPQPHQRVVVSRSPAQILAAEVLDPEGEIDEEFDETPVVAAKAKRISEPRKFSFLNDFSVSPEGKTSLKQYIGERTLNDSGKYLLASAWLMKHAGLESFSGNHVFTCFRAMKWDEPADFTQTMRRLKSKKSYFDLPTKGMWKLTGIGMEEAERIHGS